MTRCPFCLGFIADGAYICRHCKRDLIPEYLFLYRDVLEENPDLRAYSEEAKVNLERALKIRYEKYLKDERARIASKEIQTELMRKQAEEYWELKKEQRAQKIQKFKKAMNTKVSKFLILPSLTLVLIALFYVINTEEYKDWQFESTGGRIVNLDNWILKNLSNINYKREDTIYTLKIMPTDSCKLYLKPNIRKSLCRNIIPYIENSSTPVGIWFEIQICENYRHVDLVRGSVYTVVKTRIESDGTERNSYTADSRKNFRIDYECP